MLFLQSCGAYYKYSIPIDTAVERSKKVKVKNQDGTVQKLRRITKEGDQYYGITKSGKKIIINRDQIISIRPFNTTKAVVLNVLLAGTVVMSVMLTLLFQGIGEGAAGLTPP